MTLYTPHMSHNSYIFLQWELTAEQKLKCKENAAQKITCNEPTKMIIFFKKQGIEQSHQTNCISKCPELYCPTSTHWSLAACGGK